MSRTLLSQTQISCILPMSNPGDSLDQAGAILTLLAEAYDADGKASRLAAITDKDAPDWAGLAPSLFSDALKGVVTLMAVYRHLELEEGRRP